MKPFDLASLALIALLNPAVILVAIAMGRRADQWQKLFVVALAASLSGVLLAMLAVRVGVLPMKGDGAMSGLFMLQCVFGFVWGALAYRLLRKS